MLSVKCEIRQFYTKTAKKCPKSVMQVQSCYCFAYQTYCFIDVLVAILLLDI